MRRGLGGVDLLLGGPGKAHEQSQGPITVAGIECDGEIGCVAAPGRDHFLAELEGHLVDGDAVDRQPSGGRLQGESAPGGCGEQMCSSTGGVDDGGEVLDLSLHRVRLDVAAVAASAASIGDHCEGLGLVLSLYGADGAWAQLFSSCDGFEGIQLFASLGHPGRYLTIDRFRDEASWRRFQVEHREAFLALDAESERLTVGERELAGPDAV